MKKKETFEILAIYKLIIHEGKLKANVVLDDFR